MLRKALVNDIVHSFTWGCKQVSADWPLLIFGKSDLLSGKSTDFANGQLAPFASYAFTACKNYVIATRNTILLASWLRVFSEEERSYALTILGKYYGLHSFTPATAVN